MDRLKVESGGKRKESESESIRRHESFDEIDSIYALYGNLPAKNLI